MHSGSTAITSGRDRIPVALVTTVLNEARSLGPLLGSISDQSVEPAEIIVVDGGSNDNTVEVLRQWGKENGVSVSVLVDPGANISLGRNIGIRAAVSEVIAVTDGGCRLDDRWLDVITAPIRRDDADVVYGPTRPLLTNAVTRAFAAIKGERIAFRGSAKGGLFEASPSSRSLAFRKSSGETVGFYPEWLDIAEDSYFFTALKKAGYRIRYEPQAVVYWNMRDTLRAIAIQFYKYGWGEVQAGMYLERAVARTMYFAVFITMLVGSFAGVPYAGHALWLWLVPFCVPGWINVRKFIGGASAWTVLKTILLVPIASLTMETSKLLGSIIGIRLRLRWNSEAVASRRN